MSGPRSYLTHGARHSAEHSTLHLPMFLFATCQLVRATLFSTFGIRRNASLHSEPYVATIENVFGDVDVLGMGLLNRCSGHGLHLQMMRTVSWSVCPFRSDGREVMLAVWLCVSRAQQLPMSGWNQKSHVAHCACAVAVCCCRNWSQTLFASLANTMVSGQSI